MNGCRNGWSLDSCVTFKPDDTEAVLDSTIFEQVIVEAKTQQLC